MISVLEVRELHTRWVLAGYLRQLDSSFKGAARAVVNAMTSILTECMALVVVKRSV